MIELPVIADRPDIRIDGMRVLYVIPPYRTTDVLTTQLFPMPYGGVILAAILREAGADVTIKDFVIPFDKHTTPPPPSFAGKSPPPYYHFGTPMDDALAWIDEHVREYDVVGMYGGECAVFEGPSIIGQRIREHGVPLVIGGPFPSTAPDEATERFGANVVVRNEGENVVVDAMRRAADGWNGVIPGTLANLNDIPLPAWDLAPPTDYPRFSGRVRGVLAVSRGCPWDCTFCSVWTVMTKKHRRLPRERITRELRHLWDHGVRYFSFLDDNLFVSRAAVDNVLGGIDDLVADVPAARSARYYVEEGMEVRIAAEPGVLQRIVDHRFDNVALGLETVNDEVREAIIKPYTRETLERAIDECRRVGVTTKAFYIIGFPGDTMESVCADLVAFGRLGMDARPNNLKLYPGTDVTREYLEAGLIDDDYDWRLSSFWTPTNTAGLTYRTIRRLKTVLGGIGFAASKFGVRVFADTIDDAITAINARRGFMLTRTDNDGLEIRGSFFRSTPYRTMLTCLLIAAGADGVRTSVDDGVVVAWPTDEPVDAIQAALIAAARGAAVSRQETLWAANA